MAAPTGAPVPTPPPVRGAGFALGPDASNALAGGTLGGIAPAESDEERLRNMAIGTGIGVLGSRTGKPGSALAGTRTAGVGGPPKPPKPPKPDSPEAIRAALKGMAKPPKAPTRLEQMVDEGKGAAVPPVNTMPSEAGAAGSKALRMLERGRTPLDIYDETSVALLPYNGANIPIVSSKMGPEELTRVFYSWLAEPPAKRPAWVKRIVEDAPKKKGMMLTQKVEPPPAPSLPPPPPAGFPIGGVVLGTAGGIATGVPVGIAGGALMAREQERQRRQPPPPPRGRLQ